MNFSGRGRSGNRMVGLAFVAGLHALLIYGLLVGLSRNEVEVIPPPIETRIVEEVESAPEPPPPPPPPEFTPPPVPSLPPPVLNIAPPPQIERAPVLIEKKEEPAKPPPPAPRQKVRVPPKVDFERSPRACRQPAYPTVSARLREEGIAEVSLLISANGSDVLESRINKSSGHKRLDDATIEAFRRCRFKPGTVDGVPEASWFSVRYQWVVPR